MRGGAVAGGRRRGRPLDGPSCSRRAGLQLGLCNYVELIDTIFTDVEGVD
jgi:hypothetical protein